MGGLFGNGWCARILKKERKQEQRMNTVSIVLIYNRDASRRMSFNGAEPKIIIELSLFCLVNEEHLSSDNAEQEGSRAQRLK